MEDRVRRDLDAARQRPRGEGAGHPGRAEPDPPDDRRVEADDRLQPPRGVRQRQPVRPERRQLPGAAARAVHGLQPARPAALTRQVALEEAPRLPSHSYPRVCRLPARLQFPLIVKSLTQEASIGISQASVVGDEEKLRKRVEFIHESVGTHAIAERYVDGRELYVGVLGNERLQVFPVWEMTFQKMVEGDNWPIA